MKLSKIALGVSLAIAASSASATSVPGVPSGQFEYSKPGIAADADPTTAVGVGVDAIGNINSILDSVQSTGGSNIDNDSFWKAFIAPTETKVFEYGLAAPMIEELIFTVEGTEFVGVGSGGADAQGYRAVEGYSLADMLAKDSNLGEDGKWSGKYVDGQLSTTKANAVSLMELLGFTVDTTDNEAITYVDPTDSSTIQAKVISGEIAIATAAASIDRQGFQNANDLIDLISRQLKVGFILDVEKAAAGLQLVANQHNGYLSASLVDQAKVMKGMIEQIGVQEAAVGLGKGANAACTGSNDNSAAACVSVGQEFKNLISRLPANSGIAVDSYEAAIVAVNSFVDHIINFNATMVSSDGTGPYVAADEAAAIGSQFGTITVDTSTQLYTDLKSDPAAATAASNVTNDGSDEVHSDLDTGFDSGLDIDGDGSVDLELH